MEWCQAVRSWWTASRMKGLGRMDRLPSRRPDRRRPTKGKSATPAEGDASRAFIINGASPYPGREPSSSEEIAAPSVGERIGAQLEMHDQRAGQGLAGRAGTRRVDALDVHRRSVARGHPQSSALPA